MKQTMVFILNHLGTSGSQPNQVDLMVSAGKPAKTCGYIARARAPHAHVRENNAQKRGIFAAFRVDSWQKKTPCKRVARGLFADYLPTICAARGAKCAVAHFVQYRETKTTKPYQIIPTAIQLIRKPQSAEMRPSALAIMAASSRPRGPNSTPNAKHRQPWLFSSSSASANRRVANCGLCGTRGLRTMKVFCGVLIFSCLSF